MIYFLQPTDGGPVKIGHTDNLDVRRKALESHYGRPLSLLATLPGGPVEERALHERFAHLRLGRKAGPGRRVEQFRPGADLMAFIGLPPDASDNAGSVAAMSRGDRDDAFAKLDRRLAAMAKLVADARGQCAAEYLSEITGETIRRDFVELMQDVETNAGAPSRMSY